MRLKAPQVLPLCPQPSLTWFCQEWSYQVHLPEAQISHPSRTSLHTEQTRHPHLFRVHSATPGSWRIPYPPWRLERSLLRPCLFERMSGRAGPWNFFHDCASLVVSSRWLFECESSPWSVLDPEQATQHPGSSRRISASPQNNRTMWLYLTGCYENKRKMYVKHFLSDQFIALIRNLKRCFDMQIIHRSHNGDKC